MQAHSTSDAVRERLMQKDTLRHIVNMLISVDRGVRTGACEIIVLLCSSGDPNISMTRR